LISTLTEVSDPTISGSSTPAELPDGLVGMDTARLASQAAIAAADAQISMLDDVLKLPDYGQQRESDSSSAQQQSSAARQDPTTSVQVLAFLQSMQAQAAAQPEEASAPAEAPAAPAAPSQGSAQPD